MGLDMSGTHSNGRNIPEFHLTGAVQGNFNPWLNGPAKQCPMPFSVINAKNFVHEMYYYKINRMLSTWSGWEQFHDYKKYGYKPGDFSFVERAWGAGEPAPAGYRTQINAAVREAGFRNDIDDGYGQSEAGSGPLLMLNGAPVGVEVRLRDAHGNIVTEPDTYGEAEILEQIHIKGYYNQPERTTELYTEDGALKTGDVFIMNEHGRYEYKGRKKDCFHGTDGKIHYLHPIEQFICDDKRTSKAQILALGTGRGKAKSVVAQIVLNESWTSHPDKVLRHFYDACRDGLPPEEVPEGFRFMTTFPVDDRGSSKRDYTTLSNIRQGYYGVDKGGIYKVNFPKNATINRRYLKLNEEVKIH
jgi:acyl-coenzyme A synthetase/AMP-(fatty) acid ligase